MLHSEEFINDSRFEWHNTDFIELMARRLQLADCEILADVGCGMCHWNRMLVPYLKRKATIYAIDMEEEWLRRSEILQDEYALAGIDLRFVKSKAETINLPDNCCDLVTCQTLLIHVPDIKIVLQEFLRILRPGGIVLCCEPNNLIKSLMINEIDKELPPEYFLMKTKFELAYAYGKFRLGHGRTFAVEAIPDLMRNVGFSNIQVYQSDKVYLREHMRNPVDMQVGNGEEQDKFGETYRNVIAGGFTEEEYKNYMIAMADYTKRLQKHIKKEPYLETEASIMYLMSGRK